MDYKEKARQLRKDIITMIYRANSGHPGGSFSCVEMLTALYYGGFMHVDPSNPKWEDRDRFVLSKGHAAPAIYAVLADLGFFPKEDLDHLRKADCHLQGHPDSKKTPGIDMNTGSLGQGISAAVGMALAAKYKKKDYKVYALLGDGEIQEGQVWEAAMSAAHYKVDNLTILIDHNGYQVDGSTDEVMSIGDPAAKFNIFGFDTYTVNGHVTEEIIDALNQPFTPGKPKCIVCETHKGNGVSFMMDTEKWHGKAPNEDEYNRAMKELEG